VLGAATAGASYVQVISSFDAALGNREAGDATAFIKLGSA